MGRNPYKYSAKAITRNVATKNSIKKTVSVSTGRFLGGTMAGRVLTSIVKRDLVSLFSVMFY